MPQQILLFPAVPVTHPWFFLLALFFDGISVWFDSQGMVVLLAHPFDSEASEP